MSRLFVFIACFVVAALGTACGSRSGPRVPLVTTADVEIEIVDAPADAIAEDAVFDIDDVIDVPDVPDVPDVRDVSDACVPARDNCGPVEVCGNGLDDDCRNGVDDVCSCAPGSVQSCFAGPPGRRGVGVCADGMQICLARGTWGACTGGIVPREDVCNGADNLCNGCSQQRDCPILCPSPGDPRVATGAPLRDYPLRGAEFYMGPARAWRWEVRGGPCDVFTRRASFEVRGADSQNAVLFPRLSGDYTVTLTVTTASGVRLGCTWIIHIEGPGLRIEMCYPESETQDLDLYLHRPNDMQPWYMAGRTARDVVHDASCGWHNCEAAIRGSFPGGMPFPRADWGYGRSPILECEAGPQGDQWRRLGFCANPRLDVDNNLSEGVGLPENVNVDVPREGDTFRIMIQNWTGTVARPIVNVYCAGRRRASFGVPPDELARFSGPVGDVAIGAMWRVADVTTRVDASSGRTTGCDVRALHPPGATSGYFVTVNDPSF